MEKRKIIFAAILGVLMLGVMFIPKMFSGKKQATQEEEVVVSTANTPRMEEIRFEREAAKSKGFEELTAQEKAQLYMQTQEMASEVAQQVAQETAQQAVADAMRKQQNQQSSQGALVSFPSASVPNMPVKWSQDIETQKLLDKDFSAATSFYRGQTEQGKWSLSSGQYQNVLSKSNNVVKAVNSENLELFDEKIITTETTHIIPSGTYLTAITTGFTDSDYPEMFVANMSRPSILRGYKLLCRSSGNNAGRVNISVDRLISPEGKEISLSGQVEMASVPGMTGQKHSRWFKRIAPSIINAGIGGGLLAYTMIQEQKDRDAWSMVGGTGTVTTPVGTVVSPDASSTKQITEPVIQDGIGGLQKEITRAFNQGKTEDQVKIHSGTVFDILLLSPLTIKQ
jgi:hypothetical protein